VGKDILRLDPAKGDYVAGGGKADAIVARMLKKPAAERLKLLRESSNPQAQFLWAILRDAFHYAPCTWKPLPTTHATSTSRCAGASA
jgi:3-hydroxyacyl-CoA dehydrogenase